MILMMMMTSTWPQPEFGFNQSIHHNAGWFHEIATITFTNLLQKKKVSRGYTTRVAQSQSW